MCHHNTFLIHASLENPTKERWNFVTHVSVVFCMVFMLVFGLTGYATFTGNTQGNILVSTIHLKNTLPLSSDSGFDNLVFALQRFLLLR